MSAEVTHRILCPYGNPGLWSVQVSRTSGVSGAVPAETESLWHLQSDFFHLLVDRETFAVCCENVSRETIWPRIGRIRGHIADIREGGLPYVCGTLSFLFEKVGSLVVEAFNVHILLLVDGDDAAHVGGKATFDKALGYDIADAVACAEPASVVMAGKVHENAAGLFHGVDDILGVIDKPVVHRSLGPVVEILVGHDDDRFRAFAQSVSYTHLTLPTTERV